MRKISYHLQADRLERATLILTKIGLGEVIKEEKLMDDYGRISYRQLTDTGIIIVLDAEKTKVVTMWIASAEQVQAIWGDTQTPYWLYRKVMKNKKFAKIQDRA